MTDGLSWLVGFSSIIHRYEVARYLTEEGVRADLSGVENRVRETTFYGEAGAERARASRPASGRATPFHRFRVPASTSAH